MSLRIYLVLFVILFGFSACTNKKGSKKRLAEEPRSYRCLSKATLVGSEGIVKEDQQFIEVDFNAAPGIEGPTVKHRFQDEEVYVEFWSNVKNGARATGYVKKLFGRTQWSAGTSSSKGLGDEFQIPLKAYEISSTESIRFEISCKKI